MAKPQLEDGHTRIANEILEHLMRLHLAPNQWQVLLCIIRKTYGFQKKVDYIANIQIGEATNLGKTVISRVLRNLEDMKVITRRGKIVGIQKDWELWVKLAEQSTSDLSKKLAKSSTKVSNSTERLAKQLTKVSNPRITQKKETITKETIQKKRYGELDNVLLADIEHQKLIDKFGKQGTKARIDNLSLYIGSKGDNYKSHYATILSWENRDRKGGQSGINRGSTSKIIPRSNYTRPEDYSG